MTRELQTAFEAKGLKEIDQSTAMIYDLAKHTTFIINELQIIEDDNNLNQWKQPLCEAFESNEESILQYVKSHQRFQDNKGKLYHFVGFIDNSPVTSLTFSINNNIARIDKVATFPKHQDKGYATGMLKYLLSKTKELGADYYL
ncbi:GNAT family N-acetyltransferase [Rickettsiales endosymbiont of Stachyamoeba lipophora]|uniref:GNAT family N-acetyltransferase n=1 Tax=Rickettsiales endosymbiont of Stachyamoeba lipophora TaxID=2486578 RepID=UPI000F649B71|nr:GNAT family N-acetyltransferase [Rickettsiales endosymbiont of Stachyamoeba lipophora]AZL16338.1 N-acetyltransferase [Rickettsiales endosymbiont of Stachyamoeba lipophora]